jgi:hypothetical protein
LVDLQAWLGPAAAACQCEEAEGLSRPALTHHFNVRCVHLCN